MRRRRFIALAAAFAAAPGTSSAATWRGRALGADVSVRIEGAAPRAAQAMSEIPALLRRIEATFSLYDPTSELSTLNRNGYLSEPSDWMHALIDLSAYAHDVTGGLFDPTVQPLWHALASGGDIPAARARIGWRRVRRDPGLSLAEGQALTFNGIAQGFATDIVKARLLAMGATRALVDIGEHAAIGGPFRLGLADPVAGLVGQRTLQNSAIATSSPGALKITGDASHIIAPDGRAALWSTVAIEADSAALADALSTAAVFMPTEDLAELKQAADLAAIVTIGSNGDLRTL